MAEAVPPGGQTRLNKLRPRSMSSKLSAYLLALATVSDYAIPTRAFFDWRSTSICQRGHSKSSNCGRLIFASALLPETQSTCRAMGECAGSLHQQSQTLNLHSDCGGKII